MATPSKPETADEMPTDERADSPTPPPPSDTQALVDRVLAIAERQKQKKAAGTSADALLFDDDARPAAPPPRERLTGTRKKPSALLPVLHPNRDFFLCDIVDFSLKDDTTSMEVPIFSLSTQIDLSVGRWSSKDETRWVTVTPSVLGRATQFDKDILIYVISQMTEALNLDRHDARIRAVRFRVSDYLAGTNKSTRDGGAEYARFQTGLNRLQGTLINTNIRTGNLSAEKKGFGLIDDWRIFERSPTNSRMIAVELTLSEWLYNAVQARDVLTLDPAYFRLRMPSARRIYELARKHCGNQPSFTIGEELLLEKSGNRTSINDFRKILRRIIEQDVLPGYRLHLDEKKKQVLMYNRDPHKTIQAKASTKRIR